MSDTPETIEIDVKWLEELQRRLGSAVPPKVTFKKGPEGELAMAREAYKKLADTVGEAAIAVAAQLNRPR